jgi:hypothetical protein
MGPKYRQLFDQYVKELRAAKTPVNAWWARLVAAELAKTPDKVAAAEALRLRWPEGPATHPRIVAIVRKYHLACDRLNQETQRNLVEDREQGRPHAPDAARETPDEDTDLPINPAVFVGEMLISKETDDLAKIVDKFSYWPIGVDEQGARV